MIAMLIEGIGFILKMLGKLIFLILKYTFPLILMVVAFFCGAYTGFIINGQKYENWKAAQIEEYTHEITIYWDGYENSNYTVISVREDLRNTINGYGVYLNEDGKEEILFYKKDEIGLFEQDNQILDTSLPVTAKREGYVLVGFYSNEGGGSLIFNAKGYLVVTVKEDMAVYAVWEKM